VKIKYKSKLLHKIIFVPSGWYRYLKGKKVLFCWRRRTAHDANGLRRFHEIYKYAKYCRFKETIT
jgi:hypothetical protein